MGGQQEKPELACQNSSTTGEPLNKATRISQNQVEIQIRQIKAKRHMTKQDLNLPLM